MLSFSFHNSNWPSIAGGQQCLWHQMPILNSLLNNCVIIHYNVKSNTKKYKNTSKYIWNVIESTNSRSNSFLNLFWHNSKKCLHNNIAQGKLAKVATMFETVNTVHLLYVIPTAIGLDTPEQIAINISKNFTFINMKINKPILIYSSFVTLWDSPRVP